MRVTLTVLLVCAAGALTGTAKKTEAPAPPAVQKPEGTRVEYVAEAENSKDLMCTHEGAGLKCYALGPFLKYVLERYCGGAIQPGPGTQEL